MKTKCMIVVVMGWLFLGQQSWGSVDSCRRRDFSHEQLINPYAANLKKTLEKYSGLVAENIARGIEEKATYKSNSFLEPCLSGTLSCFGQDAGWTYSKEMIRDTFGNKLRLNGEIISNKFTNWPADHDYYAHRTQIGYTCSWGGEMKAYCEKWCSLTVVDDRWHD